MLKIVASNQFKKDLKIAIKRKLDIKELNKVIMKLSMKAKLDDKYKDHGLKGAFSSFRECHIKPDWLLIYRIESNRLELFLFRTGSHSDLYK